MELFLIIKKDMEFTLKLYTVKVAIWPVVPDDPQALFQCKHRLEEL